MKLQIKLFLAILGPLMIAVIAVAGISTVESVNSILAQMRQDGVAIAQLLTVSSSFAVNVPQRVEDILGNTMAVEARTTAQLVAVAEQKAHMTPEEIKSILKDIVSYSTIDEFWITDEKGKVYISNTDLDWTFKPDPVEQPQSFVFYSLLSQKNGVMIQESRKRELDQAMFKYVGVSGIDKARIVQVGYRANILNEFSRDMNAQKLVDDLTGQGNVAAIRVVDATRTDVAVSSKPLEPMGETLSEIDDALLHNAFASGKPQSAMDGDVLKVAAPLLDMHDEVASVALVYLRTDEAMAAIRGNLLKAVVAAMAAIALGVIIAFVLSRSITRPLRILTDAAESIEGDKQFKPETLHKLTKGTDELAQMARVFSDMAIEVQARELRLKKQMEGLQIQIDQNKKARQVAEITETDYFQSLRARARELREQHDREEARADAERND